MIPAHAKSLADVNMSQLILIDVQTRLGAAMSDSTTLLRNCNILLESANLLGVPVTVTEQYPKGIGPTSPELVKTLGNSYKPVEKTCFSSCGADQFMEQILQHSTRNQFILCGIEAHVCVLQTAMDLLNDNNTNWQIFVVADAVDSRSERNRNLALSRLQQAGAIITCTESVVFEWMKNSSNEHFKKISNLIR